jgi:hypothetical protein
MNTTSWRRCAALALVALVTLVAAACGGSRGDDEAASPSVPVGGEAPPAPPVNTPPPASPPANEPPAPPTDNEPPAPLPPGDVVALPPEPVPPSPNAGAVMFVTQAPVNGDTFCKITSTFCLHLTDTGAAPRGGDLWIAYPRANGAPVLRNLTAEAGYGVPSGQDQNSAQGIAVRDPAVHWSGQRAVFSMVQGTASGSRWQLFEISGFAEGQTVSIRRLPQPAKYNHVQPTYDSAGHIVFASDMPRAGPDAQHKHLWPQLDEYEEQPTVSGLWRMDPLSGDASLLNHAPSGSFRPSIDSFGRIVFTNWDHLQRDQQAGGGFGLFNFRDESASAQREPISGAQTQIHEVFPEKLERSGVIAGLRFNIFLPWMLNQDGTGHETLNHIGRHELGIYGDAARSNAGLSDLVGASGVNNSIVSSGTKIDSFHYLREDPLLPGSYLAVAAPEFGTHGGGMVTRLQGGPGVAPQDMRVKLVTAPSTRNAGGPALYRSPLPTSDGRILASVSSKTATATSGGNVVYDWRLQWLGPVGAYQGADGQRLLTPGLKKRLRSAGAETTLWELDAVEVRERAVPPSTHMQTLEAPEAGVFAQAGVEPQEFIDFLRRNNLALLVSRNVTKRDSFDRQQPFNLRIKGSATSTVARQGNGSDSTAPVFDVDHLQFLQGDQLRGIKDDPSRGRRVLAQPMRSAVIGGAPVNPPSANGPVGAVRLADDGSMAALAPARRALTWQLVEAGQGDAQAGTDGVVRERYWLSFQPGEVRVCASCHGLSQRDQRGASGPTNPPQALAQLLQYYKDNLRGR